MARHSIVCWSPMISLSTQLPCGIWYHPPFLKSLDKVGNLVKDTVIRGQGRIRIQTSLKLTFIPLLCSDINNIVGELTFVWCYGLPGIGLWMHRDEFTLCTIWAGLCKCLYIVLCSLMGVESPCSERQLKWCRERDWNFVPGLFMGFNEQSLRTLPTMHCSGHVVWIILLKPLTNLLLYLLLLTTFTRWGLESLGKFPKIPGMWAAPAQCCIPPRQIYEKNVFTWAPEFLSLFP